MMSGPNTPTSIHWIIRIGGNAGVLTKAATKAIRCSAIAERPRCRVRYSFRQRWKTGTGRQVYLQPLWYNRPETLSNSVKKRKIRAITAFKVTEVGTNRKPVCDFLLVITALHGMQTRSSDEISVRPSVRPSLHLSVRHIRGLWQNCRKICPDLYTISFSLVFLEEEGWWGGDPLYLTLWVNRPPLEQNRRFSTDNRS